MRPLTTILAGLLLMPVVSSAIELLNVTVEHEGGRYSMRSEVWFDVERDVLFEVFQDWDLGTQFSSWIVESKNLDADEHGRPGFLVRNRGCLLFFCKSVVREGYVEAEPPSVIRTFADPERSDFEFSNETWTFAEERSGTLVHYEIELDPKFWVPPVIGPWLIKRKLRNSGGDALARIETIAQEWAAND